MKRSLFALLLASLLAACGGGGGDDPMQPPVRTNAAANAAREQILKSIYCLTCIDVYSYEATHSTTESYSDGNISGSTGGDVGTVTNLVDENGDVTAVSISLAATATQPAFTIVVEPVPGGVNTTDGYRGTQFVPLTAMTYNYMSGSWQLKITRPTRNDP
jgi:hypothetical protein